jgi:exopolyphosphatase/guanosine-5'-triphosphate,3'-diphosphate pyrophosphatase
MRCACIDIGTNTTRLLVAEDDGAGALRVLAQERAFTELGDATEIGPEKTRLLADAVGAQTARARELGTGRLRVVATGALREASDRDVVLEALSEAGRADVEVLSSRDEAALAFTGALATMRPAPEGVVAVVDVGGGSSEIAVGRAGEGATWWASMPVGSGRLTERILVSDPPSAEELDAARAHARAAWEELGELPDCDLGIAVGGSAASLPRLVGERLDEEAIARALELLTQDTSAQVARVFELDPRRVRLLPAGLVVLEAAARRLASALEIGRGGLREGVVLALMADT